jgi:hypothetical protein
VGQAIETTFTLPDSTVEIVVFQYDNEDYTIYYENRGSTKADDDVTTMLDTLQPAPAGGSVS